MCASARRALGGRRCFRDMRRVRWEREEEGRRPVVVVVEGEGEGEDGVVDRRVQGEEGESRMVEEGEGEDDDKLTMHDNVIESIDGDDISSNVPL